MTPSPLVIGPYDLLERVGEGGMGEVWRARHRTLGRLVAVKLVRAGTLGASVEQDREILRRFEREARTAAALRSPHAIQVQDFGVTTEGHFYQVMELLDGLDLGALVARFGPQPPGRVVALLRQAVDALADAHERGFVHRDVKPSNLFLCRLGTRGDFVKVLDFGLARPVDAGDVHMTRTGAVPGSPATLAPEVLRGEPATEKADVYALGCVATWLLAGRLPFAARSPIEMVVAHLEKAPPPLPEAPPELAGIVSSCLEKDPAKRPSARELSRRLAETRLEAAWSEEDATAWWELHQPARAPTVMPAEGPAPDREQVYQRLRRDFEASRIDLGDYERRLEVARRATSPAQVLDALRGLPPLAEPPLAEPPLPEPPLEPTALVKAETAPLARAEPAPPAGRASRRKLLTVLSSTQRGGAWHPDAFTRVVTVLGNAELDLRLAELGPGLTELRCVVVFGSVEITVPPGLYVELDGLGVAGSFEGDSGAPRPPGGDAPHLRISGVSVFGSVEVRVKALPKPGPSLGERAAAALELAAEKLVGKLEK